MCLRKRRCRNAIDKNAIVKKGLPYLKIVKNAIVKIIKIGISNYFNILINSDR